MRKLFLVLIVLVSLVYFVNADTIIDGLPGRQYASQAAATIKQILSAMKEIVKSATKSATYVEQEFPKSMQQLQANNFEYAIKYGTYIGLTGAVCLVVGILLFLVFIFWLIGRCCCCCGPTSCCTCGCCVGCKPRPQGYGKGHRWTLVVFILFFSLIAALSALLGMISNSEVTNSINVVTSTADSFFGLFNTMLDDIGEILNLVVDRIESVFSNVQVFSAGLPTLLVPFGFIDSVIVSINGTLTAQLGVCEVAALNLTLAKGYMQNIIDITEPYVEGFPDVNTVPSITSDDLQQIIEAQNHVGSVRQDLANTAQAAANAIAAVQNTIQNNLDSAAVSVKDSIQQLNSSVLTQMRDQLNGIHSQYNNDVTPHIEFGENIRSSVLYAVFGVGAGIFIFGLLAGACSCCKATASASRGSSCFMAVLCMIFLLVFFILGALHYTLGNAVDEACPHLLTFGDSVISDMGIQGISNISSIATCSNMSLITVILPGAVEQIDQAKEQVDSLATQVEGYKGDVDVDSQIATAKSQLDSLDQVANFHFEVGFNITDVRYTLQTKVDELSDLSRYNLTDDVIDDSLAQLNSMVDDVCIGPNPEDCYHFYYTYDNLTTLDVTTHPFSETPQQFRDGLNATKEGILTARREQQNIKTVVEYTRGNVSAIDDILAGVDVALSGISGLSNVVGQAKADVTFQLDDLLARSIAVQHNISGIATQILSIGGVVDLVYIATNCDGTRDVYVNITNAVCISASDHFQVMSFSQIVIGLCLTAAFFLGVVGCKKLGRPFVADASEKWNDGPNVNNIPYEPKTSSSHRHYR